MTGPRVLMLVATSVATDTRVVREAQSLVLGGYTVHIVGRSVPTDFVPPDGITVSSVGTSSAFRREEPTGPRRRSLALPLRFARWFLLPQHRNSAYGRWADGVVADASVRDYDVVHAHDFTALAAGRLLADARGVPLVYDTHEFWTGRPREYRPTPWQDRRERREERRLGASADAVITVGDGVAAALEQLHGWSGVFTVRNTFPRREALPALPPEPRGLVYAGRLAAYRELEVAAAASSSISLPLTVIGPADPQWLAGFDAAELEVLPAETLAEVDDRLVAAGAALVAHSDAWANHRLSLPNKLFHAVSLGVPVVATDVGELATIVREHDLGTLYRPGDARMMAEAVQQLAAEYPRYAAAVRVARSELSWEQDARTLLAIYAGLPIRR